MALREGEPRKDGTPAKKPGYLAGNPPAKVGRPRRTTCALPGCELPPMKGLCGPQASYCSVQHRSQHYRQGHVGRYGITVEDYKRILSEQGGVCAICGASDPHAPGRKPVQPNHPGLGVGSFHVDHDHITGKFRGLLCGSCNRGLGQFRDSIDMLERAAAYLRRSLG